MKWILVLECVMYIALAISVYRFLYVNTKKDEDGNV